MKISNLVILLIVASCSKVTSVNSTYLVFSESDPEKASTKAKMYSESVPVSSKNDSIYLIFNTESFKYGGVVLNDKDTLTFDYAKDNIESGILLKKVVRKGKIKISMLPENTTFLEFRTNKKYLFYDLSYSNYKKSWYLTYCTFFCGKW